MNDFGYVILGTLLNLLFVMLIIGWIPAAIAYAKGRNFFPGGYTVAHFLSSP